MSQKITCGVEYFSTSNLPYCGFQKQAHAPSIQETLEKAISAVADRPIQICPAGRTDKGVHAVGQIIHFETDTIRSSEAWVRGVNAYLPPEIRIQFAQEVSQEFHARYSATARRYEYWIDNQKIPSAFLKNHMKHHFYELDIQKMHKASRSLLGEQDFSAFRSSECQSKTPYRNIHNINITRYGGFIKIDIQANAFLHHMVRNIVGSLLPIGDGREPEDFLSFVLSQKDRNLAGMTADPQGLYLLEVIYPEVFQIPRVGSKRSIGVGLQRGAASI